MGVTKITQTRI